MDSKAYMLMDTTHKRSQKIINIKSVQVYNVRNIIKTYFISLTDYMFTITTDIDECTMGLSNCGQSSICLNTIGSFSCHCAKGFIHNISSGCHSMPNFCSDGIICDKNAICKHIGGLRVCKNYIKNKVFRILCKT